MNLKRVLAGVTLSVFALGGLTACGSDRPSEEDISKALVSSAEGSFTNEKFADCMAKFIHDSELSDEALKTIVENPEAEDPDVSEADKKVLESPEFQEAAEECFTHLMEDLKTEMPDVEMPDLEAPSDSAGMDDDLEGLGSIVEE